jgi:hypothetical protein
MPQIGAGGVSGLNPKLWAPQSVWGLKAFPKTSAPLEQDCTMFRLGLIVFGFQTKERGTSGFNPNKIELLDHVTPQIWTLHMRGQYCISNKMPLKLRIHKNFTGGMKVVLNSTTFI